MSAGRSEGSRLDVGRTTSSDQPAGPAVGTVAGFAQDKTLESRTPRSTSSSASATRPAAPSRQRQDQARPQHRQLRSVGDAGATMAWPTRATSATSRPRKVDDSRWSTRTSTRAEPTTSSMAASAHARGRQRGPRCNATGVSTARSSSTLSPQKQFRLTVRVRPPERSPRVQVRRRLSQGGRDVAEPLRR